MLGTPCKLSVEFPTEADFRDEYVGNIANGGIFVAGESGLQARDPVIVELRLTYCDQQLELEGEVVHSVGSAPGVQSGVAVQFVLPARALREQLEPFMRPIEPDECALHTGRRAAPRARARVATLVTASDGRRLVGCSRDISSSGMLVSITDDPIAIGERVQLQIEHPRTGKCMSMAARVARHLTSEEGEAVALAVEFLIPEKSGEEITAFLSDLRATEHSRRLGSISGPIAELGIENLLQMFGAGSPQGWLGFLRGAEEGEIWFEGGQILGVRLGRYEGSDALRRLLCWRDGRFEFQANLDDDRPDGRPVSIDAAVLEALCELDEERPRPLVQPPAAIDATTRLGVDVNRADAIRPELSKAEEAALDLALGGLSIGKMVTVIPEPEVEIYAAVNSLIERGLVSPL